MKFKFCTLTLIIITLTNCRGQIDQVQLPLTCECNVNVFTLSNPETEANVSLTKNGFNVMTLKYPKGEDNENSIFFFNVTKCDEGWLNIQFQNQNSDLWFEPNTLGIVSRRSNFKLYQSPSKDAQILNEIKRQEILVISGCENKWALVNFKDDNGIEITGWISPEDQCDNPFTTCP